jgi:hypothetical protein
MVKATGDDNIIRAYAKGEARRAEFFLARDITNQLGEPDLIRDGTTIRYSYTRSNEITYAIFCTFCNELGLSTHLLETAYTRELSVEKSLWSKPKFIRGYYYYGILEVNVNTIVNRQQVATLCSLIRDKLESFLYSKFKNVKIDSMLPITIMEKVTELKACATKQLYTSGNSKQNEIKPHSGLDFESPAEEAAYPIVQECAKELGFNVQYQKKIYITDYYDWIHKKYGDDIPEWIDEHNCEDYPSRYDSDECRLCYTYEKYRIDFYMTQTKIRVAVEVDSRKFHDEESDGKRDEYLLKYHNIRTIRLSANDALY